MLTRMVKHGVVSHHGREESLDGHRSHFLTLEIYYWIYDWIYDWYSYIPIKHHKTIEKIQ